MAPTTGALTAGRHPRATAALCIRDKQEVARPAHLPLADAPPWAIWLHRSASRPRPTRARWGSRRGRRAPASTWPSAARVCRRRTVPWPEVRLASSGLRWRDFGKILPSAPVAPGRLAAAGQPHQRARSAAESHGPAGARNNAGPAAAGVVCPARGSSLPASLVWGR